MQQKTFFVLPSSMDGVAYGPSAPGWLPPDGITRALPHISQV
jgi:hypothetical protein